VSLKTTLFCFLKKHETALFWTKRVVLFK
jgi:hypothetical protein